MSAATDTPTEKLGKLKNAVDILDLKLRGVEIPGFSRYTNHHVVAMIATLACELLAEFPGDDLPDKAA